MLQDMLTRLIDCVASLVARPPQLWRTHPPAALAALCGLRTTTAAHERRGALRAVYRLRDVYWETP